jgi:hypothetical protein
VNWSAAEVVVAILGIVGSWLFGMWTHSKTRQRDEEQRQAEREDTRQIRTEKTHESLRTEIREMGERVTRHVTETTLELRRYIDAQDRATVSHLDGRLNDMERHSRERHEATAQTNRDLFASRAELAAVGARLDIIERRVRLHTTPPPKRYSPHEGEDGS